MNKPMMDLSEFVEKGGDADLLREMIGFAVERLMEFEIGGQTGAVYGKKSPEWESSATATATRTGKRGPGTWIGAITSCRQVATSLNLEAPDGR